MDYAKDTELEQMKYKTMFYFSCSKLIVVKIAPANNFKIWHVFSNADFIAVLLCPVRRTSPSSQLASLQLPYHWLPATQEWGSFFWLLSEQESATEPHFLWRLAKEAAKLYLSREEGRYLPYLSLVQ